MVFAQIDCCCTCRRVLIDPNFVVVVLKGFPQLLELQALLKRMEVSL
jgi:hypothetical protein